MTKGSSFDFQFLLHGLILSTKELILRLAMQFLYVLLTHLAETRVELFRVNPSNHHVMRSFARTTATTTTDIVIFLSLFHSPVQRRFRLFTLRRRHPVPQPQLQLLLLGRGVFVNKQIQMQESYPTRNPTNRLDLRSEKISFSIITTEIEIKSP